MFTRFSNKAVHLYLMLAACLFSSSSFAAEYKLDIDGAHAFVNFKIKHLGYSWLTGRFNRFDGNFSYDAKAPNEAKIKVIIDTSSIDSNHAERDKHLRSADFLDVKQFPTAIFTSSSYQSTDANNGIISGTLELHGVKREISFPVEKIGEGRDPWGGYRAGFSGSTSLSLSDYDIQANLGPQSTEVLLELHIEGIRQ